MVPVLAANPYRYVRKANNITGINDLVFKHCTFMWKTRQESKGTFSTKRGDSSVTSFGVKLTLIFFGDYHNVCLIF